ncbi:SMI1/KNR4 family protein [uncultured Sulfitobacter sp.]|uniref:SMI1/KNR4 family protein n=1 Tax=uncultured Sulfitobacter sp. TaxID=191468 RepID=UPI0026220E16|nr:SMI1/KNR4 family protein [uncultured Sulfitobacter sp.]
MSDALNDENVAKVIEEFAGIVRDRWDKLGYLEGDGGAFATGHTPAIAPQSYLCRFYAGLSEDGLKDAESESERHLPHQYRSFLSAFNGGHIMGISLHGSTGGSNLRQIDGIGQPVSIRYQNVFYTRPDYIPEGHFGLGAMNGEYYSQGHLYLTSTGEVELINREHNLIAKTWPSLAGFLSEEIPRQLTRYDEAGLETKRVARLPGNTDDWEALGKAATEERRKEATVLQKVKRGLGGLLGK